MDALVPYVYITGSLQGIQSIPQTIRTESSNFAVPLLLASVAIVYMHRHAVSECINV